MIRLRDQTPEQVDDNSNAEMQTKRSAIVEPKRKPKVSIFGNAPRIIRRRTGERD